MNPSRRPVAPMLAAPAQRGMALVTVLVIMSVASMLGISAFQSALTQERITGNQRVGMQARMAAEAAVVAGRSAFDPDAAAILDLDDLEDGAALPWQAATSAAAMPAARLDYLWLRQPAAEALTGLSLSPGTYVLGRGRLGDGRPVERQVLSQVAGDFPLPELEAVFTCFGPNCAADADGHLDGANHPLPEDFACQGRSCRTTPASDRDLSLDIATTRFYDPAEDDDFAAAKQQWLDVVSSLPAPVASYDGKGDNKRITSQGTREAPVVIEVTAGSEVKINANTHTAGVILVRDGGVLGKANGTAHHEGLIIVEPGGRVETNGTFNLYGGIIALEAIHATAGDDDDDDRRDRDDDDWRDRDDDDWRDRDDDDDDDDDKDKSKGQGRDKAKKSDDDDWRDDEDDDDDDDWRDDDDDDWRDDDDDDDDRDDRDAVDLAAGGNAELQYSRDAIALLGRLASDGEGDSVISWLEL